MSQPDKVKSLLRDMEAPNYRQLLYVEWVALRNQTEGIPFSIDPPTPFMLRRMRS